MSTTSTTLNDVLKVATLEAKDFFFTNAKLADTIERYNIARQTANIPIFSALTAAATPNENVDASIQAVSSDVLALTAQHYTLAVRISKMLDMSTDEDLALKIGKKFGRQMIAEVNDLIWGGFPSFTTELDATDTTGTEDISIDWVKNGLLYLAEANAPGPYTLAVTPYQANKLMDEITSSTNSAFNIASQVMQDGKLLNLLGCNVMTVADLPAATGQGATATAGLYAKEAIAMNMAEDLRIETEVEILKDSTLIVGHMYVGGGVMNADYGVAITTDNSAA